MEDFIHPELRDSEVFFTNATGAEYERMSWRTKRLGVLAYDGEGNVQTDPDWYPVFVQRHELEEREASLSAARNDYRKLFINHQPI